MTTLVPLKQPMIDWLLSKSVSPDAIIKPTPIMTAKGSKAHDGIFEEAFDGLPWLAFEEDADLVYWRPKTGELATECGRTFALGQDLASNPYICGMGTWLNIYADPISWLRNDRSGLVILRWEWCFEFLRDVARIAVEEPLLAKYRKHMRPPHLPELAVLPSERRAAA